MEKLDGIAQTALYGGSVAEWAMAAGVAVAVYGGLWLLRSVVAKRLRGVTDHRRGLAWAGHALKALEKTKAPALAVLALGGGAQVLSLPARADTMVGRAVAVALFLQAGFWIIALFDAWYEAYRARHLSGNPAAVSTMGAVRFFMVALVWLCTGLLILDNMGFDVTALIAGLGIGGVAMALAVQKVLGDLLASLSILIDRPFVVGDTLAVAEHMGTVENIGLKTTRLRSLTGEQLVFSNADLLASRIRNYGRMRERRVLVAFSVTYQTPIEKVEAVPGMLRGIIESCGGEQVRFDRAHFKGHGPSGLEFEYVYYIASASYNVYMDIQQAINLATHRRFAEEGIRFAHPTQTVYVEKAAG